MREKERIMRKASELKQKFHKLSPGIKGNYFEKAW